MKVFEQAPALSWALGTLLLVVAGCGDGAGPDQCVVAPPTDPSAYAEELLDQRAQRDQWFRTAPDSPVPEDLRSTWDGLQYFDIDPRMRLEGPLIRRMNGRRFQIATTSGDLRPCQEIGYFELDLGAGVERLPVYELLDQAESSRTLFVPFMDATTGTETYPAGRYLEAEPIAQGRYRLDFNEAYNPSCAYGGRFQCPVTPEENRLKATVRAGEKGWHHEES